MSKICVNCVKEINGKEAFCLSCHQEVVETALERCYEYHKKHSTPADWIYHISKEEYIKEIMKGE